MKLFLKIFGAFLILLLVVFCSLPYLLSLKTVQPSMISQLNSSIPGRIEIRNYSLTWFGGILVEGFQLKDPQGELVLDCERFETDSSLFEILLQGKITKNTEIKSLNAHITVTPSGKTNLEESLGSKKILNLISPFLLSNVNLKFSPVSDQSFTLLLNGKTIHNNQKGEFIVDLLCRGDNLHTKVKVENFPISIIEACISNDNPEMSGALASIFGDYINVSINETTVNASNLYQINAHSEVSLQPQSNLKPVIWNAAVSFVKPTNMDDLANVWMGIQDFNIRCENIPTALLDQSTNGKSHFQSSLGDLVSISMKGTKEDTKTVALSIESDKVIMPEVLVQIDNNIQLNSEMIKQRLKGIVSIGKLHFPQESPETTLSNVKIEWEFDGRKKNFEAQLFGNLVNDGTVKGKVVYHDSNSNLYASLHGEQIPANLFDLLSGNEIFTPAFGQTIETNIELDVENMNGLVNVDLKGQNGNLALKGKVDNGLLTLNVPFYFETKPSQKLGQELKKYSPILGELQSGDKKISLSIDQEGFSAPIFNFDINKVRIKQGTADLGKLLFNNKGDLKKASKFLNAPSSEKVTAWFTPLYFSMDKGILDLARTDLLIFDNYPLAAWGNIDFQKNYVDAIVALSGPALESAFGIKGMGANNFLQLPLKGKFDKVKIDTSSASTRIAALFAKQQGGPEGLLLGTVLDMAQGSKEKTPAPTTNPLPWSDKFKTSNVSNQDGKNPSKKQLESAAKDLLKGILSIPK